MNIESVFSPGGELDSVLPSYSFRSGQLEMARLVDEAIGEGKHLVVEAGTGIGKSFAYLAPIFLRAAADDGSAYVIATSTITLEKQLYDKDIPILKKALGLDIETAILFGRSNYLCVRRWEEARLERKALGVKDGKAEAAFDAWAEGTETGASAEIEDEMVGRLFPSLASDEKDCPSFRCPFYQQCYFYSARRKAQKARIIVTNHHLLLLDAKNREETGKGFEDDAVLPSYQVAVIDEAHHIEAEATDILSLTYSSDAVSRYLDYLTRREKRFGSASILDFLSVEEKDRGVGNRIKEAAAHIRTLMGQYDRVLSDVFSGHGSEFLLTEEFYSRNRERLREGEVIADEESIRLLERPESLEDRFGYSYGYFTVINLIYGGIDVKAPEFAAGILTALYGAEPIFTADEMNGFIDAYVDKMAEDYMAWLEDLAAQNLSEAEAFLEDNAGRPEVTVLPSGVQIEYTYDEEEGAVPSADDTVNVDYTLTLMDGTVMDQGDGVSFSLSSLIPGFTYAVEAMNVGDSVRAYIPPELGYGEMGTQTIEPNSLLIFDITLNSIETPSEN